MPLQTCAGHATFVRSIGGQNGAGDGISGQGKSGQGKSDQGKSGQGPEALFLHCSLAHYGAWLGVWQGLRDQLGCTGFDFPGHGRSGDWDGQGDYTALCVSIAASLAQDGPLHLVGHSYGGAVALHMAAAFPERVASLTLIEPVMFAAAKGTEAFNAYRASSAPLEAALARGDLDAAGRAFNLLWGVQPWEDIPEQQRAYMRARMPLVTACADGIVEDIHATMESGLLEALRCPVHLVQGDQGAPIVDAILSRLARMIPHARRHKIAGAGHMAPVTHPAALAALIATALEL